MDVAENTHCLCHSVISKVPATRLVRVKWTARQAAYLLYCFYRPTRTHRHSIVTPSSIHTGSPFSLQTIISEDITSTTRMNITRPQSIMTRLRNGQWVRDPAGTGTFLFATAPRPDLKPIQPSSKWKQGTLLQLVERPERESNRSFPSSVKIDSSEL